MWLLLARIQLIILHLYFIIIINKMSEFGSSSVPSIAFQSSESTRQMQREQISVDLNNVLAMNAG